MGGQAALAQDTTSLPEYKPSTASPLGRALTSPHCHLRVEDYGDRKGTAAFPKKKEPINLLQSTELFPMAVLSLLRNHRNDGKISGVFLAAFIQKLVPR